MPECTLKRPSQKAEMALIANACKQNAEQFLTFLQKNPAVAKRLGKSVERARRSFDAAYPGQTRSWTVPNAIWDKAGHQHVAAINRAMGLQGS